MNNIILIKYGELTLKKGNIKYFIDCLYKNINHKLKGLTVNIIKDNRRMFVEYQAKDQTTIIDILKHIAGIYSFVICYKVASDLEKIKTEALNLVSKEKFNTFKVETKRSDKTFKYNSNEISRMVGSYILKNIANIKVDVHHPELLLNIEVRKDYTYLYTNEIKGLGGYPVGIQGKGMLMLSGGIDSPVAGFLALKKGIKLECIYFESIPHTSIEARNKVINLIKKMTKFTNEINLHIIPFTKMQETIYQHVDPKYMITIMRRMMYRITELLAKKNNCLVIVNGESIGQVASQTLSSMAVINEVTNVPIIRPLSCMDKIDIIDIAKKIATYDISILPFQDCCTVFVPKHPVTNPKLEKAILMEKTFNYEDLIKECLDNVITIKITDIEQDNLHNLL